MRKKTLVECDHAEININSMSTDMFCFIDINYGQRYKMHVTAQFLMLTKPQRLSSNKANVKYQN